jgi:hypothetical protein
MSSPPLHSAHHPSRWGGGVGGHTVVHLCIAISMKHDTCMKSQCTSFAGDPYSCPAAPPPCVRTPLDHHHYCLLAVSPLPCLLLLNTPHCAAGCEPSPPATRSRHCTQRAACRAGAGCGGGGGHWGGSGCIVQVSQGIGIMAGCCLPFILHCKPVSCSCYVLCLHDTGHTQATARAMTVCAGGC